MLSPSEFTSLWGSARLVRFPASAVDSLLVTTEDKAFLTEAGLPDSAAPFLSFDVTELPTLADMYRMGTEFRRYRVFGSDGGGNPIAIDEQASGEVVWLDHECRFARYFVNSSIRQMAESLLAYRKLVRDTQAEFGEDAYLDGKTSSVARKNLRDELTRIDAAAVEPGTFWQGELQNLDADAG